LEWNKLDRIRRFKYCKKKGGAGTNTAALGFGGFSTYTGQQKLGMEQVGQK
jgi:hypothetical protein